MSTVTPNTTQKSTRLVSLDALRGFDMFWIMSGEDIVHTLAKATNWPILVWFSGQLHHTVWDGITFYDMIFPLFLFIAGVSTPYSLQKKMQQAGVERANNLPWADKKKIYLTMLRRTCTLLVLGMVVNGMLKFNGYHNIRFASVLGRIGLAWFFAGLIFLNFSVRGQIIWFAGLLIGYWAAMMLIPVPGYGAGVLTMDGSLESYIDRLLLPGRLHDKIHDPEGVLSTIPAIGTALLGVFTGSFLQSSKLKLSMGQKAYILTIAGLLCIGLGELWDLSFPINKRLWSSSFVLFVGGFSLLFLAIFYFIIDARGIKKWAQPFVWIGTNSILIYLCAEVLVNFTYTATVLFGGLVNQAPVIWQPVWHAVSITVVQLVVLYWLYKKKIFFKI